MSGEYYCGGCGAAMPGEHKYYCHRLTTTAHIFEPAAPPLPSALAGETPEGLRKLADDIHPRAAWQHAIAGTTHERADACLRAAAILRAIADSIEQMEGEP